MLFCFGLFFPQRNNSENDLLGACTGTGIYISLMRICFRYSSGVFLNPASVKELGWPKLCGHERGNEWKCSVERAVSGSSPEPKTEAAGVCWHNHFQRGSNQVPNSKFFFCRQEFPWVKKSQGRSYAFSRKLLRYLHIKSPTTTFSPKLESCRIQKRCEKWQLRTPLH